ncbi:hypothetical protein E4U41_005368, partial [Claviceps citrina]
GGDDDDPGDVVLHGHVNRDAGPGDDTVNPTDVHEALRGALSRLSHAAQSRSPLPEGCTFSLAVELRDEAPAPIRSGSHPSPAFKLQPETDPIKVEPAAEQPPRPYGPSRPAPFSSSAGSSREAAQPGPRRPFPTRRAMCPRHGRLRLKARRRRRRRQQQQRMQPQRHQNLTRGFETLTM